MIINVIAAFGPKKSYAGAMFGIARVLHYLSTNTNNEGYQDQQISKMITSVCIEFAQSHDPSIAISAFQKNWNDANDEMKLFMMKLKDGGKLSGEMPKKVKVLYSAMYVYIELAENILKVINLHSDGKVIRQVATFYNEVYSKWGWSG